MSQQLRILNDALYHSAILYERVEIIPTQFTHIDKSIEEQIKRKVGNKCTKEGFISKNNITILDRSIGTDYGSKFNGNIIYTVKFEAVDILMPRIGQIITCQIKEINESAFMCDYDNKIFISVPLKYYETEDVSNSLSVSDIVDIEIKRIVINSNNIFTVGKLHSINENRINVVSSRILPDNIMNENVKTSTNEQVSMYAFLEKYDILNDLRNQIQTKNIEEYKKYRVYYDDYLVQSLLNVNPYSQLKIDIHSKKLFFDLWQIYNDTKLLRNFATSENEGQFTIDVLYTSFEDTFPFYALQNKMTHGQKEVNYIMHDKTLNNTTDMKYQLYQSEMLYDLVVVNTSIDAQVNTMLHTMIDILESLSKVRIGGSFILNTTYIHTNSYVQLIHLLYSIFNKVHIIRTLNTSVLDNMLYVVCISKLTDEKDEMISIAYDKCSETTEYNIDNLFNIVSDDDIVSNIENVYYSVLSPMYSTVIKIGMGVDEIKTDKSIVINNHKKNIAQWLNMYKSNVFEELDIDKTITEMIETISQLPDIEIAPVEEDTDVDEEDTDVDEEEDEGEGDEHQEGDEQQEGGDKDGINTIQEEEVNELDYEDEDDEEEEEDRDD